MSVALTIAEIAEALIAADKVVSLLERRLSALPAFKAAREAAKAEGRDMTAVEFATVHLQAEEEIKRSVERIRAVRRPDE
jgi:hypothetical protein